MRDVSLDIEANGIANLSERGSKTECGGYNSVELINYKSVDGMRLSVDLTEDDAEEENIKGMVKIRLCCYHVPTEGEERHFHSFLEIFLCRKEAEQLHGFIGFLLAHGCFNETA
jgi:hypothetical protein